MPGIDYNAIALDYDRRYELYSYSGVRSVLRHIGTARSRVLELGCGTGKWLAELESTGCETAGVDPSPRMLQIARTRTSAELRLGISEALPWPEFSFDVVLCVNSLHHFSVPVAALHEAFRVLRLGGKFLSVGLDPHEESGRWYVYDFFPQAAAADRKRFPSKAQRIAWLQEAGFTNIAIGVAERIHHTLSYEDAVRKGVLERTFTSQLTTLPAGEYAAGLERIHEAAQDADFRLQVDLALYLTSAERPG